MHPDMPIADARAALDRLGIAWEQGWGPGRLMKEVYDERVQHDVVGPVFVHRLPARGLPAGPRAPRRPGLSERFELIVAGFELCNAYTELNDPVDADGSLRGGGAGQARRRPRGRRHRPRLRPRPRVRHAAHRRAGHRHRPARDAAGERRLDPRGHPLPDAAPRVRPAARRRPERRPPAVLPPTPMPAAALAAAAPPAPVACGDRHGLGDRRGPAEPALGGHRDRRPDGARRACCT